MDCSSMNYNDLFLSNYCHKYECKPSTNRQVSTDVCMCISSRKSEVMIGHKIFSASQFQMIILVFVQDWASEYLFSCINNLQLFDDQNILSLYITLPPHHSFLLLVTLISPIIKNNNYVSYLLFHSADNLIISMLCLFFWQNETPTNNLYISVGRPCICFTADIRTNEDDHENKMIKHRTTPIFFGKTTFH